MAELRQAFAVKIRAQSLRRARGTRDGCETQSSKRRRPAANCRRRRRPCTRTSLELTDAHVVLQRFACEAQANATELEVCRRVKRRRAVCSRPWCAKWQRSSVAMNKNLPTCARGWKARGKGQCCICLEARAAVALVPCGHVCVCRGVWVQWCQRRAMPDVPSGHDGVLPVFAA